MTQQQRAPMTALALAIAVSGCAELQAPEQAPSPTVPEYSTTSIDECSAAYGLRLASEDPSASHTGDYVIYIHGWDFVYRNCTLWFGGVALTIPIVGSIALPPFNADEKGHELLLELARAGIADIADFRRFTYASFNKIERAAEALRAQLVSFPAGSRFVLVGHSMGGLVARRAAQLMTTDPSVEVIRIITLGTPHKGTEAGRATFWSAFADLGLGTDGARDLRVNSSFLTDTLNSSSTPENRTIIYALAGDATASYTCLHGEPYCSFLEHGWSQFASLGKASDAIVPTTSALGKGVLPLSRQFLYYDHLDLPNGRASTADPLLRSVAAYVDAAFRGSSATVKLTPRTNTLTVGSRIRINATVRDESGNIIAGRPVNWQSSNPAVAAVDQNGIVTGNSVGGPVTITARSDTKKPGTATITVLPAISPPAGGAVHFDGHDDYISVPSSSRFNTTAITIEAWIRLDRDVTNEVRIISRESSDGTRYDWSFGLLADNYLIFDAERGGGSSGLRAASSVPLKAGFWHHVAAVATPDSVFLYLNGRSDTRIASPGALSTSSSPVFIGNGNPALGRQLAFPGAIDEVRLWRVARGQAAIPANMSSVLTPPPNSLEAYWRFEEGTGTTTHSSSRPHTGTVVGATWLTEQFMVSEIYAGAYHTCALTLSGAAYCWGWNALGQVGDGTTIDRDSPVNVASNPGFTSFSPGGYHTCALTAAGEAYCWGRNDFGQLGDGTDIAPDASRSAPGIVLGGLTFSSLVSGESHSCGLTTGGAAFCWGSNEETQLGDGTDIHRNSPVNVAGNHTFTTLSAGFNSTCALKSGGEAYCWGWNGGGFLGDGTTLLHRNTPVRVAGTLEFSRLSTGSGGGHKCGIALSGVAYCWGVNNHGQLGNGTTANRTAPALVAGSIQFTSLSLGSYHTCGLTSSGAAYCWGENFYGNLGDGTTTDRSTPTLVLGNHTFASVSAGEGHSCGVTSSGAAYCWGYGGSVGDGTTVSRSVPTPVIRP